MPGAVKFPLTNVVDGKSKTVIEASLADLLKGGFAINAHLSAAEIGKYVACGAIKSSAAAPSNPAASSPSDMGYGYGYK